MNSAIEMPAAAKTAPAANAMMTLDRKENSTGRASESPRLFSSSRMLKKDRFSFDYYVE
jgi:hypothetical protein